MKQGRDAQPAPALFPRRRRTCIHGLVCANGMW